LNHKGKAKLGFVKRNGTQFVVDDKPLYVNGWNSYWFMDHAVDEHSRNLVGEMLEAGAKMGLTVCRTWAFNDGGYNALQISPGRFDERVFQVLMILPLFYNFSYVVISLCPCLMGFV